MTSMQPKPPTGIELIATERQRHAALGWTAEHDDLHHRHGDLVDAAIALAFGLSDDPEAWYDELVERYQTDRLRQLTIAGALIAAEIDRLQRTAGVPDGQV